MWLNPPWSLWPKVTEKLMAIMCAAICVVSAWSSGWLQSLVRTASKRVYIEQGSRIFEVEGKPSSSTFWGVWALSIDKGDRVTLDKTQSFQCLFIPRWRPLKSMGKNPPVVLPPPPKCQSQGGRGMMRTHPPGCWSCTQGQDRWGMFFCRKGVRSGVS